MADRMTAKEYLAKQSQDYPGLWANAEGGSVEDMKLLIQFAYVDGAGDGAVYALERRLEMDRENAA